MVKILAFYDASFGCYATNRRTDRIPEFNTSLIGLGKNHGLLLEKSNDLTTSTIFIFLLNENLKKLS
jgi:hypothetical protein